MTKTEAIETLKYNAFVYCNSEDCIFECVECHEALKMAIKALGQETVSREMYDHEYRLRKEFEMKAFELEKKIAEQEQIIYCKECKHWHEWENGTGACHRSNSIWVGTDYDDFCSFAEQKESDTE